MSDVEKFFEYLKQNLNGTRQWSQLHPMEQIEFIDAINTILRIVQQ